MDAKLHSQNYPHKLIVKEEEMNWRDTILEKDNPAMIEQAQISFRQGLIAYHNWIMGLKKPPSKNMLQWLDKLLMELWD